MKKVLALALAALLVALPICTLAETTAEPTDVPAVDYATVLTGVDTLSLEDLTDLQEYIGTRISELKASAQDPTELAEATRLSPALIGQTARYKDIAITITQRFRGASANMFMKDFDSYNTSRYSMEKGLEWILCRLKIECFADPSKKVDIATYDFKTINENGVDITSSAGYGNFYGNPSEIGDLYGGATQEFWFGVKVPIGQNVYLTYICDDYYINEEDTLWFDLQRRLAIDTSSTSYTAIGKGSTRNELLDIQYRLAEYDFMAKLPSGKYDSTTINAIKKFQKAIGVKTSGTADEETLRYLYSGKPVGK